MFDGMLLFGWLDLPLVSYATAMYACGVLTGSLR
jgi:hypothetical protein